MFGSGKGPLTVAIQAGGKSTRMGRDKSFVPFEGRPMIEVVRDRVAGLGDELILITNNPEPYAYLNLPAFGDIYADCGPLGGIHSALANAASPYVLMVACDMPWLNRDLLEYLVSLRRTADIVVPRLDKFPEPLHAVYSKACLDPIETKLKAGDLKITRFYGQVNVRFVDREEIARFDPQGRSFTNINSPEDLPG
ncbi:MAG: molybdenum cofactor guanylyltransferase [Candidatus Promineifilaceae bacterium]